MNFSIISQFKSFSFGGKALPDLLVVLMAQDKPTNMQLAAARCLTYLHRAGALSAEDPKILFRTLPCLVRLCHKEHDNGIRAVAAETLGYLSEVDTGLQRLASISNHLIATLASFFKVAADEVPPLQQQLRQAAFRVSHLGKNILCET
jgi:armadillo repeat-containing protein 8